MKTEKEQALERLANAKKEIAECEAILNKKEELKPTAREWMQDIWNQARMNPKLYSGNCMTYCIGDDWYIQQDWENKLLPYSYNRIYLFLSKQYGMEYSDIGSLVKDVVRKDINCDGLTPQRFQLFQQRQVRKDINCDGLTPFITSSSCRI